MHLRNFDPTRPAGRPDPCPSLSYTDMALEYPVSIDKRFHFRNDVM